MKPFLITTTMIIITFVIVLIKIFAAEPLKSGNHYFTADWCKYCQKQGVDIQILQNQGYTIEIYNQEEIPEIFKDLNIKALPYFIIVKIDERGRKIVIRLKGKQPIRKLIKVLIKDE